MDFTEGFSDSEVNIKWQYQSAKLPRPVAISAVQTGNWRLRASRLARSAMSRKCRITYARNAAITMAKKSSWQQNKSTKKELQRRGYHSMLRLLFLSSDDRPAHPTKPCSALQSFIVKWQRGWDSNPRWLLTTLDFESSTFDHSDTSPCSLRTWSIITYLFRLVRPFILICSVHAPSHPVQNSVQRRKSFSPKIINTSWHEHNFWVE